MSKLDKVGFTSSGFMGPRPQKFAQQPRHAVTYT
jgi:hypothetical protein